MATIELKAIKDVCEYKFFIPDYQRGYRWRKEQVNDLLDDLKEFYEEHYKKNQPSEEIYCIQPLVVMLSKDGKWDVIDGQQRLTTIYIILSCLAKEKLYSIEYQTRDGSKNFLENIGQDDTKKYKDNADFYHMHFAYETVSKWKTVNDSIDINEFSKMIKERVTFIWYELDTNEDPIKVFTRLNIGKISLTESELIKALFLNRNNFSSSVEEKDKLLTLVEIANEWDKIEYRLQDDRFWLFFHGNDYTCPTRIDFILNLIRKMDLTVKRQYTDKTFPTFAYFYDIIKKADNKHKKISEIWGNIYSYFAIIEEWYNDEEIYHYIGYLSSVKSTKDVEEYLKKYHDNEKDKSGFIDFLRQKMKESVKNCRDLDYVYEEDETSKKSKTGKIATRPLLLLHNVQTIIDQNTSVKSEKKYDMPEFIRFPFHLFKKEKWDVEHIRPNNLQDFQGDRKGGDRLKYVYILRQLGDKTIKKALKQYDRENANNSKDEVAFETLWKAVNDSANSELTDMEKNKIWNYVLLDSSTNREYGNACFSIKRDYVLKKEKGIKPKLKVDNNDNVSLEEIDEAAFVPICTRKVFSKEFSQYPDNLMYWTEKDAAYYRMNIEETLWWYLTDENIKPEEEKEKHKKYKEVFKEYRLEIVQKKEYGTTFEQYLKNKEMQNKKTEAEGDRTNE